MPIVFSTQHQSRRSHESEPVLSRHHGIKCLSTLYAERRIINGMIDTTEIGTRQLSDLIKQVQAGDEVLLTQGKQPVAKLVSAAPKAIFPAMPLRIRSFKDHQVLTPVISQAELAEDIFGRQ
jgi:antitoxin (DNA-binding transcriptional repressor) of toxin-antitoxin stability system